MDCWRQEHHAEWCGSWRPQNSNTKDEIGIMVTEGKLLALLLTHYDLIVYLGFSLWRKMIQRVAVKNKVRGERMSLSQWGSMATEGMSPEEKEKIRNIHRAGAGYLTTLTSALPEEFLEVQKPVKMSDYWKSVELSDTAKWFSNFLLAAVKQDQADVVVILVKTLQIDTSKEWWSFSDGRRSLLCQAAIFDSGSILRHLLDIRPADSFPLEERCLMLTYAAWKDAISSLTVILTHPTFAASTREFINMVDTDGDTAINMAIKIGSSRVVSTLIQHGVDLQNTDDHGRTPAQACELYFGSLAQCAAEGQLEEGEIMLDVGLHVDGVPNQTTPLHRAAEKKQTEMVRFLLQRGADADWRSGGEGDGEVENS